MNESSLTIAAMERTQQYIDQARAFFRSYTEGMTARDMRRLFDRDAVEAYAVLARDQKQEEPKDEFKRFLHRTKVVFLGLSYRLTPARRALFAGSLLFLLLGLFSPNVLEITSSSFQLDFSPLYFVMSFGCMTYLLLIELVDRVKVRDELEVARNLQRDLMPKKAPAIEGYSFAHSYRTANDIGGDYYDFVELPDGRVAILVGDASGHGIAAGLLMAIANTTLKTAIDLDPDPVKVVTLLNETLCRTGNRRAFMSLFYALLEPETGEFEFVSAGHPFPLVRRAGGDVIELGHGSLPLGVRQGIDLRADQASLGHGDLMLLFSDGIPEALSAEGRAFGFNKLRELLQLPGSPAVIHDRLLMAFDQHIGHEPIKDDLSVVVMARA